MNKIVREHFPAERLPAELREGFALDAHVTVTVEAEAKPIEKMSLEELFALRQDVFRSYEEINEHIHAVRDGFGE